MLPLFVRGRRACGLSRRLIPGNAFGLTDLNAINHGCSPAHALKREHPSGAEYATYLDQACEISVLTGFLGSRKTTILNYLVRHPALKRTLVIINEFGAIGLDHEWITHREEDVLVEMSSGCLCCTIRADPTFAICHMLGVRPRVDVPLTAATGG